MIRFLLICLNFLLSVTSWTGVRQLLSRLFSRTFWSFGRTDRAPLVPYSSDPIETTNTSPYRRDPDREKRDPRDAMRVHEATLQECASEINSIREKVQMRSEYNGNRSVAIGGLRDGLCVFKLHELTKDKEALCRELSILEQETARKLIQTAN